MSMLSLPIYDLAERHHGVTPAIALSYLEATRVSLDQFHVSPATFTIHHDDDTDDVVIKWNAADERTLSAWANRDDATRDGAYACAIATCEHKLGLFTIRRAETLTGADYYVAPLDSNVDDLEQTFRLEVSGTILNEYDVKRRLVRKLDQAKRGRSNLPALAIVVGFKVKAIHIQFVE